MDEDALQQSNLLSESITSPGDSNQCGVPAEAFGVPGTLRHYKIPKKRETSEYMRVEGSGKGTEPAIVRKSHLKHPLEEFLAHKRKENESSAPRRKEKGTSAPKKKEIREASKRKRSKGSHQVSSEGPSGATEVVPGETEVLGRADEVHIDVDGDQEEASPVQHPNPKHPARAVKTAESVPAPSEGISKLKPATPGVKIELDSRRESPGFYNYDDDELWELSPAPCA